MLIPEVPINKAWQDAIDGWLLAMQCDGLSQTTIRSRKSSARVLARCMIHAGRIEPSEITKPDMVGYMIAAQEPLLRTR
jgi:hypothetical protein